MEDPLAFIMKFGLILTIFIITLIIWSGIWKGVALWKSARNNHLGWFITFMFINTLGILEILYIYVFSKKQSDSLTQPPTPPVQM
ncbi:MAG TPA: hypothetical protein DEB09_03400 [Candidatus Magasanikbacteria bacterium]|nr:hypothetical protein [Candidatus Magasanikbacteria bacterium]